MNAEQMTDEEILNFEFPKNFKPNDRPYMPSKPLEFHVEEINKIRLLEEFDKISRKDLIERLKNYSDDAIIELDYEYWDIDNKESYVTLCEYEKRINPNYAQELKDYEKWAAEFEEWKKIRAIHDRKAIILFQRRLEQEEYQRYLELKKKFEKSN